MLFAGVRWWGAIDIGNFDGFFRKGCGRGLWLVGREVRESKLNPSCRKVPFLNLSDASGKKISLGAAKARQR